MCMNIYRNINREKVQFDFVKHGNAVGAYEEEIVSLGGRIYTAPVYKVYNHIQYCNWWKKHLKEHTEHQIIHGHYYTLAGIYLKIAEKMGRTTIAHSHSSKIDGFIKQYLISTVEKNSEYHFACSENAGKWMFPNTNFTVIKNAIDTDKFTYNDKVRERIRSELGLGDSYVIGTVGSIYEIKNPYGIIDIFLMYHNKNSDSKLLWIGDGPMMSDVKNKVNQLGLDKDIILLGNRSDVHDLLQAMDVFILPSIYEGLPVVLIEAQASGLPCICSTAVTEEVDITGNCSFINNDEKEKWISSIEKHIGQIRKNTKHVILDSGYDIHHSARMIEEFYISHSSRSVV
ncbi:MAG: glycosyltransferase [Oscillospiraceae bacterium]|nr:glycosyltransferase [Oscillospiraceae bacterium]